MFTFIFLEHFGFFTQDFSQTHYNKQTYDISMTLFWHLVIDSDC